MKSLKTLTLLGMASLLIAPAHAYERCKRFENAELKAMTAEGLENAYCLNEDRLLEILEAMRASESEEAKRDGDACWETLIKLTAQPKFERDGRCPAGLRPSASASREEIRQRQSELLRNLGMAGEKGLSTR